jgi:DNA replication protein DnaC
MAVVSPPDVLDEELVAGLRRLKLRRVRELAPELCLTARTQRWRPEEFLRVLIREECIARDGSNREQRLRAAGFPLSKALDTFTPAWSNISQATFDYLSGLEWIDAHRNVILVGPAGLGKSHLCVALGRAAVEAGHRVRYFRADMLTEALYRGLADNTVGRVIDSMLRRTEVVVLDELGYVPFDQTAGNHFFRFIATAYETRSLVLSSNWPFEEWTNFLPDTTTATAILDRLLHHADVVVVSGDSVRLKEAREHRERHSGSDLPKSEPL